MRAGERATRTEGVYSNTPLAMEEDETSIQRIERQPDARRRGRAFLTALSGQGVGSVFRLSHAETTIGRGVSADIRINEDGVSRLHAKVVREHDGTAKIIDLNSTNGTYVNGRRVDVESLREGDRIRVGLSATLDFRHDSESAEHDEPAAVETSAIIKQHSYDNLAGALDSLGKVHSKHRKFDQAIAAYRRTLAIRERKFGPKHPAVAAILDTIGSALQQKGDHGEAAVCHLRAVEIYEALGARTPPPEMAHVLVNLGEAQMHTLKVRQALESLQRARDMLEARQAAAPELARVRFLLAQAFAKMGRDAAEIAALARDAQVGFSESDDRRLRERANEVDQWLRDRATS